jgi:hypothetical protein
MTYLLGRNLKSQSPNPKQIPITEIQNSRPILNPSMTFLDIGKLGFKYWGFHLGPYPLS